jgi:hypothetical protein
MCTVLLPPGGNPIAVDKYIDITYFIIMHGIHSVKLVGKDRGILILILILIFLSTAIG